jgi:DNA-binding XRE family transcriptional regulator
LTVIALGERVGIPHQRICEYESGRSVPRWGTLIKLIRVLGVGLVDLG